MCHRSLPKGSGHVRRVVALFPHSGEVGVGALGSTCRHGHAHNPSPSSFHPPPITNNYPHLLPFLPATMGKHAQWESGTGMPRWHNNTVNFPPSLPGSGGRQVPLPGKWPHKAGPPPPLGGRHKTYTHRHTPGMPRSQSPSFQINNEGKWVRRL